MLHFYLARPGLETTCKVLQIRILISCCFRIRAGADPHTALLSINTLSLFSKVMSEYGNPGQAERVAGGRCPLMWAQGLYIIGKLLHEEFIAPGELDPMNRYIP